MPFEKISIASVNWAWSSSFSSLEVKSGRGLNAGVSNLLEASSEAGSRGGSFPSFSAGRGVSPPVVIDPFSEEMVSPGSV